MPEVPRFDQAEVAAQPEPKKNKPGLSRRQLGGLAAAALGGAGLRAILRSSHTEHRPDEEAELPEPPDIEPNPKPYPAGQLKGSKVNDLYCDYLGLPRPPDDKHPTIVGEQISVDFRLQLQNMWRYKNHRSGNNHAVVQTGRHLRKEYDVESKESLTTRGYFHEAHGAVEDIRENLDWKQVQRIKKLDPQDLALLQNMCRQTRGMDLVAYSLTELMPTADGELNAEVLEFLLQNGGRRYVESIPAKFDPKDSFGPYQFTEYALYDNGHERRGASIINQALPQGKKIPGSVGLLRGADHHRAAYLFMINNFSDLIADIRRNHKNNAQELLNVLGDQANTNKDHLVVYAAAAHHLPRPARKTEIHYLSDTIKGTKKPSKSFEAHAGKALKLYAHKTQRNLEALKKR